MTTDEEAAAGSEQYKGDEYTIHLDEESIAATKRKSMVVLVGAVIFGIAAIGLSIFLFVQDDSPTSNITYTVDSSRVGVPDDCNGMTAFCGENNDDGTVKCTCGDYLYIYDETNYEWVLYNDKSDDAAQ
eukprot:CAMPEP_0194029326 /NCGR_PEP_ID=MMETSP0009_2-20130614/3078_1 /TAXON_ID=210454 /ORGANISM="Grammatophora oceanica, Strain CCMP 410" /LENGTH=128 /DNA_ID=CAMNT_0038668955 /DNA_START=122 /DNA_END=508 /DNA_ORIENTATION=-